MPERQQDHRGIALAVPFDLRGLDESLDLGLGQVLPGPQVAIAASPRGNCSFTMAGVTSLRCPLPM